MNGFEELEVWKECRKLRIEISGLVKTFLPAKKLRLLHFVRNDVYDTSGGKLRLKRLDGSFYT
jgi:hypothetical protein